MFKTDKLYIWPCDGIEEGATERREVPLCGFFAVKFGKSNLERALCVTTVIGEWSVWLDGFMLAPASTDWRKAFGKMWERAEKSSSQILLGRPLAVAQYVSLIKARAADKERGIDLSGAVDLNSVEIPFFSTGS